MRVAADVLPVTTGLTAAEAAARLAADGPNVLPTQRPPSQLRRLLAQTCHDRRQHVDAEDVGGRDADAASHLLGLAGSYQGHGIGGCGHVAGMLEQHAAGRSEGIITMADIQLALDNGMGRVRDILGELLRTARTSES